ncbi:MAG TPA: DUF5916 domain-containing protein [Bacteroidales bacterium]|nr:DUF5916 domain-containing protein [Bacteroidales bacterium]
MKLSRFLSFFLTFCLLSFFVSLNVQAISSYTGDYVQQDTVYKSSNEIKQPVYTTTRLVTDKPVIDGKLDDECWQHGTWAGDFHQWIPHEGAPPTYPTEINIQYDDKNIYVAIRAWDGEPEKIVRMSTGRDKYEGDVVGLSFDSYRDYRTGFEFHVSAWGQKTDNILFNPMNWDSNWNAVWDAKAGMEDSAWVAEMEIPFSQLRYSREEEQIWGMHVWRWISRLSEESDWEIQSSTGPGMLYNFGELRGIKNLKPSRRIEIMPFALGSFETFEANADNPFNSNGREWGGSLGLDAKIGVSSNFTIDLTINPDFGQVESDPSVMNLSAFETFYEEKRPFFLEGLTIFDYDFDDKSLFYSRRIGHSPSRNLYQPEGYYVDAPDMTTILSALKFSGTTSKGLSVGLIQSITANEFARISDSYGNTEKFKVEPLTNYTMARIRQGYNEGNTFIGGIITSTNRSIDDEGLEFLVNDAFTGGLDLRHHWKDKKYYLDARLVGSYVDGSREAITILQESSARYFQRPGADYLDYNPERTSLGGHGGKIKIGKGSQGLWKYATEISWVSPGLELNDMGYMNQADEVTQSNEISFLVTRPFSIFNTFSANFNQFNSWNFNSTYMGSGASLAFSAQFRNNYSFRTHFFFHSQGFDPRKLRGGPDMIVPGSIMASGNLRTDGSKRCIAGLTGSYGRSGNNSGWNYSLMPSLTVRPLHMLKLSVNIDYSRNVDELQYVTFLDQLMPVSQFFLGTIDQKTMGLTFRADLNITPEISLQYYGSPFVSRGSYSEFKRITSPGDKDYDQRFVLMNSMNVDQGLIELYEQGQTFPQYLIRNPDFNFHEFRSNLVARWEFNPGSYLYLVWSSDRSGNNFSSEASLGESYKFLGDVYPGNIFLVKFNYWFSL